MEVTSKCNEKIKLSCESREMLTLMSLEIVESTETLLQTLVVFMDIVLSLPPTLHILLSTVLHSSIDIQYALCLHGAGSN